MFLGIEVAKDVAEREYGLVANKSAFTSNNVFSFISNLLVIQALGFHDKPTYNLPAWSISTEFYTYSCFATIWVLLRTQVTLLYMSALLIFASITLDSGALSHNMFRCIEGFFVGVITYHFYVALPKWQLSKPEHKWYTHLPGLLSFAGLIVFLSLKNRTGPDILILPVFAVLIVSIEQPPKDSLALSLKLRRWRG